MQLAHVKFADVDKCEFYIYNQKIGEAVTKCQILEQQLIETQFKRCEATQTARACDKITDFGTGSGAYMISCLIIADDLTGANATGVLMTKSGYKTFSITNEKNLDLALLSNFDSLVYATDSRSLPPAEAYERVFNAAKLLKADCIQVY